LRRRRRNCHSCKIKVRAGYGRGRTCATEREKKRGGLSLYTPLATEKAVRPFFAEVVVGEVKRIAEESQGGVALTPLKEGGGVSGRAGNASVLSKWKE